MLRYFSYLRLLDYLQGKVKIDEYVTHSRTLADINDGFDDMHVRTNICICWRELKPLPLQKGDCIRCVVDMS